MKWQAAWDHAASPPCAACQGHGLRMNPTALGSDLSPPVHRQDTRPSSVPITVLSQCLVLKALRRAGPYYSSFQDEHLRAGHQVCGTDTRTREVFPTDTSSTPWASRSPFCDTTVWKHTHKAHGG